MEEYGQFWEFIYDACISSLNHYPAEYFIKCEKLFMEGIEINNGICDSEITEEGNTVITIARGEEKDNKRKTNGRNDNQYIRGNEIP
jgi:hypothetical protein